MFFEDDDTRLAPRRSDDDRFASATCHRALGELPALLAADAPPLDTTSLSTFGVRCSVFGQPTDGGRGRRDEAAMPGLFTLDLLWVRSVL